MRWEFLGAYKNVGLLIMRLGLGVCFILHGYPKIASGPGTWEKLGGAMATVGVSFAPAFWGFMAALTESAGGILLCLGFYFRPAVLFLAITMLVALNMHVAGGDPFRTYSHALELAIVFLGLLFVGPGRFSIDRY